MTGRKWNPRFVRYAQAHDKTPDAMLAHDIERFPGGRMAGFTIWMRQQWAEFDRVHKHGPNHVRGPAEQDAFDAWLEEREKTRRLAAQWPKKCGCGATYQPGQWDKLPKAYPRSDEYSTNEARHCGCGSTLEVMRGIHNLEAE